MAMHSPHRSNRGLGPANNSRTGLSSTGRGPPSPGGPPRRAGSSSLPSSPPGSPAPHRGTSSAQSLSRGGAWNGSDDGAQSPTMSRVSSLGDCRKDGRATPKDAPGPAPQPANLFHIIQQLAAAENALWNILDGLKSNTTHSSFFCREYWGSSGSQAQLSLERLQCNERLKRQVQQACVLESLSLGVASHLCSGTMNNISVTIRSRLRNLLYYIHENCLVLLDMVCQRWMQENQNLWQEPNHSGHCPENLNLEILIRVKRYRRLRRGEHVMALRQHNEMITNVVRQLCRGAVPKRAPLSGRALPGDRSPGLRSPGTQCSVLSVVNDILTARTPLDRLRASNIRTKMLQSMSFRALLNLNGDGDCPWPAEDPYTRYGAEYFAQEGSVVWFEPLPPMLPNLEQVPKLPALADPLNTYTLVLDLDETLVHYFEHEGIGNYDIRPGMHDFLTRMNQLGYELVIFTAATQDYADWVIDQIDPTRLIHHRLYRQHALPWGPIFVKDMSKLGRDLERTLIIDNVQENFMLQPNHGIFIATWYDDPEDTALRSLTPLLEELISTRTTVPEILDKYRDQIPTWAGFDAFSQYGGEYSDFEMDPDHGEEVYYQQQGQAEYEHQQMLQQQQLHAPQQAVPYPQGGQVVIDHHPAAVQSGHTQPAQSQQAQQAPYSGRFQQQQTSVPPYQPQTRQGGYPQQGQQQAAQPQQQPQRPQPQQQAQQQQPQRAQPQQQGQQQTQQPQRQPQQQHQVVHHQAPRFSGIAGPCQAPPLSHATHGAAPPGAQMWNRAGLGPCQAARR
eukprot:TRINITY_DN29688_c0_g2_i1.p1 TRINITY_DN29688_c0_g2~~TRINITY_DN29688_c0_g2_i1.p1  ORF type:complete len:789 (+),score=144.05 TRINITY_DN29688_c0_g2_i1:97-2463(+)